MTCPSYLIFNPYPYPYPYPHPYPYPSMNARDRDESSQGDLQAFQSIEIFSHAVISDNASQASQDTAMQGGWLELGLRDGPGSLLSPSLRSSRSQDIPRFGAGAGAGAGVDGLIGGLDLMHLGLGVSPQDMANELDDGTAEHARDVEAAQQRYLEARERDLMYREDNLSCAAEFEAEEGRRAAFQRFLSDIVQAKGVSAEAVNSLRAMACGMRRVTVIEQVEYIEPQT